MGAEVYDPREIAAGLLEKVQEASEKLVNINIMVLGKTGAGKSTLINNVFREKLAATGSGKPVTSHIRQYRKADFPLTIYDTPGLGLGGENTKGGLLGEVLGEIDKGIKSLEVEKAIHCIWYCVSTTSHRFEDAEREFINKIISETSKYRVPVILVLTQSYSKKDANELMTEIEKENLDVVQIVPVLAEDFEIDEEYTAKAYGLDRLIDVVEQVIPEAVKNTVAAVQKTVIGMKRAKAQRVVATSAAAAAAIGAMPIPLSDAPLLAGQQKKMLEKITAIFGVPMEKAALASVLSATIGASGATTALGKTAVSKLLKSKLLKFIPGGNVACGVASGGVAAALTAALGEAYIGVMTLVVKGDLSVNDFGTKEGKEVITRLFKERLRIKRGSTGQEVE